jgi:hypothetical protein
LPEFELPEFALPELPEFPELPGFSGLPVAGAVELPAPEAAPTAGLAAEFPLPFAFALALVVGLPEALPLLFGLLAAKAALEKIIDNAKAVATSLVRFFTCAPSVGWFFSFKSCLTAQSPGSQ